MAWDYTITEYKKQADADPLWRLERLIMYGLRGEKLDTKELKKYVPQMRIPENKRAFLELLIWNRPF